MNLFETFVQAQSQEQQLELQTFIYQEGYPALYKLLEQFRVYIKAFEDHQIEEAMSFVEKGRALLPEPGRISPAWTYIWDQFAAMVEHKGNVFNQVPADARDGEWQILIDNPFMNREVACYPGLTFMDAAYIYAKFRPELENNEYIRLQKIVTHVTEFGAPDKRLCRTASQDVSV